MKTMSLMEQEALIFNTWNAYDIIKHRNMSARMKRYIKISLEKYSAQDICNAIINYSKVLHRPDAWYKFTYRLDDFLANKIEWFLDDAKPMERFFNKSSRSGDPLRDGEVTSPPATSPPAPDFTDNFTEKFLKWKEKKSQE